MNKYRVYSKDGRVERCRLTKVEYSGTFMGDRVVTSSFTSATEIAFDVFDYIEFRGEKFELEMIPTVKKVSSYQYEYDLRFVSLKYELERCMFRDFVPNDNEVVYPTPVTVEFTGKVNYLTERIQACLDRMYGAGVWSIVVSEGVDSEEKNLSLSNQNCWNALSLVNTEYKLNFHITGRTVVVGDSEGVQGVVFEYGKGNGLYEIERAADSDTGIVTKLIAYGGTRNLDYSYPKKPEWSDSVLPNTFILSPLRLMLPSFKLDGKTDYLLADDALIAKYGIREGVMMYDDIYPTITGATNSKGERIDKIAGVDAITDEETSEFDVYLNDLGFDLNDSLTTETPQLVMKTGALQGYSFNIKTIGALSNGGVRVTLEKNSIDNSDTGGYYIPNKDFNMSAGDEFVLIGILMPQLYIRNAEQRLEERAREYLNQYSTTNYSYSIGVDEIFMAKNPSVMAEVFEGKKMKINDAEIGINEELVTIQSLTIEDGDGLIPRIKVTLNNNPSASTLERIQGQIANIESTANSQYSAQTELAKQYQRKLNTSYFNRLFVAIDANGKEIAPNDTTTPIASVRVNYGLWTEQFLSAKGMNSGGGSDEPTGGATTLGGLRNVAADADRTYDVAKMLVLEANSNLWTLKNLSELVGGLDEAELAEYLTNNNYAKKTDIPSLSGYATEQWVLGKGYATTSDLDNRIDALVNGAPQAYDTLKEIADVLAGNVDSIADILDALGTKVSKTDFNTAIANVNNSISALNTELSGKIDLKLDAVTFNELFEKVQLEDGTWAIKAKLGLFSDGFISAKGSNVGGTSSEGGAVALYQLNDVLANGTGVSGATDGAVFVYDGKLGKWKGIAQSEIVPNLTGYATESWVLQQGFLTQHQDLSDYAKLTDIPTIPTTDINKGVTAYGWGDHSKVGYLTGITSALVTNALGYTPYDAANFTKANIKSTLGISDWALASSKPSYTTKEVAEDTNLYFTNARAVAALKSITDGLSSSITSNTTKITNLTAKVDDHIAVFNSMFKLVELSDGTMSIQALRGLWSDGFISAKGANSSGGSSSGGGLITSLYRYSDLGKTFSDTNNDTFNAYTINKINSDLGSRISVLEGKATNVSFTQSLTSGTQIGTITIDGASKNIYAPTIPTSDINKGVTAYGWGNHASVGYLTSASSLAWSKITGKPTTIGGYGIIDAVNMPSTNLYYYDLNTLLNNNAVIVPYFQRVGATSDVNNIGSARKGVIRLHGGGSETQLVFDHYDGTIYHRYYGYSTFSNWRTILHSENYDDYTYSKSTIDTKLGGYLPLSGGTISGDLQVVGYLQTDKSRLRLGVYYLYISNDDWRVTDANWQHEYSIIHSGNIGSQSVDNADKLDGYHAKASNTPFDGIPVVRNDGVMEIGKYIDFHNDNTSDNDYDCRLDIQGNYKNIVHLPTSSGILALLTSNVASATKLQTARTIWGQSFDGTADVSGALSGVSQLFFNSQNTHGIIRGNLYSSSLTEKDLVFNSQIVCFDGNLGIGIYNPQYKLDVNGSGRFGNILINKGHGSYVGDDTIEMDTAGLTLYMQYYHNGGINMCYGGGTVTMGGALNVKKAATFDGVTSIGAVQAQYDANRAQLSVISTANMPAMLWLGSSGEKKWSVESRGEADSYRFSLYSWVSSKHILKIEHNGVATLDGTFNATIGIYSDGYVSAKGQNTSSDMRLKNVLNEVVLGVKDIANAPSIRFSWKNGGGVDVGSSAQYWQGLLPDAVKERDGMLEMQYANIALLSAIALARNFETHEERIARLERENKELRNEINMMKGCIYE